MFFLEFLLVRVAVIRGKNFSIFLFVFVVGFVCYKLTCNSFTRDTLEV